MTKLFIPSNPCLYFAILMLRDSARRTLCICCAVAMSTPCRGTYCVVSFIVLPGGDYCHSGSERLHKMRISIIHWRRLVGVQWTVEDGHFNDRGSYLEHSSDIVNYCFYFIFKLNSVLEI